MERVVIVGAGFAGLAAGAELGVAQISELVPVAGIEIVGLLPPTLQAKYYAADKRHHTYGTYVSSIRSGSLGAREVT
jgi:thioredoxin reductase